ncbi:MAG TPA: adenine phosphoribosyltransferase [Jatrophihabitantaceae bacterium]|nr:adenine phosphoribosyltransferase [Jatrophihabitantaceae bacterium]
MTAPSGDAGAEVAALVAARLRDVPDFPQPGIVFKDIAPLLADGHAFSAVVRALAVFTGTQQPVDVVAGVEARGFLLAGALALEFGCGLVPVRKAGKLPPPTVRQSYTLEYGTAEIEVPVNVLDGKRVLLVDDVLATGGTLRASAELIQQAGGNVVGIGVLLELGFLDGRTSVGDIAPLHALLRV